MPVPYIFWLYDRGYHRDWAFLAALIVMGSCFFVLEVPIRRIDARRVSPAHSLQSACLRDYATQHHGRRGSKNRFILINVFSYILYDITATNTVTMEQRIA